MLKKTTITKLKGFGFDYDKLVAAISAEDEQDFDLPEINNLTDAQLAERDTNTVAAAKEGIFKQGKDAGIEIANKAIAKKYNLADIDVKDVNKVIAALDTHVAKGDDGLKEQVRLLQADKDKAIGDLEAERANTEQARFDAELLGYFPQNRTADLPDTERLLLIKHALQFDKDDTGARFVKKDGQPIRDKTTQAYTPVKNVIESVFNERKWVGSGGQGGRGGDDNPGGGGGKATKYSQVVTQYMASNPGANELSPGFMSAVQEAAAGNADFDWGN